MAEVILKNVRKVYDKDVVAVDDANIEIRDKEFVVLVDPRDAENRQRCA